MDATTPDAPIFGHDSLHQPPGSSSRCADLSRLVTHSRITRSTGDGLTLYTSLGHPPFPPLSHRRHLDCSSHCLGFKQAAQAVNSDPQ